MKKLFIVRHAKSEWANSSYQKDIDRPLNNRGISDSYKMSNRLKEKNIIPDLIISSSGIRALHTAIIFSRQINFEAKNIKVIENLYHSSSDEILRQINLHISDVDTLFVFAHNPGIEDFVSNVKKEFVKVATCSIIELELKKDTNKITFNDLTLVDFDFPKKES